MLHEAAPAFTATSRSTPRSCSLAESVAPRRRCHHPVARCSLGLAGLSRSLRCSPAAVRSHPRLLPSASVVRRQTRSGCFASAEPVSPTVTRRLSVPALLHHGCCCSCGPRATVCSSVLPVPEPVRARERALPSASVVAHPEGFAALGASGWCSPERAVSASPDLSAVSASTPGSTSSGTTESCAE